MTLYKTMNGYRDDRSSELGGDTFILHYDASGVYLAQTQDDAIDGGTLRIGAVMIDGAPCVNGKPVNPLTVKQMKLADDEDAALRKPLAS